ncbi:MAG: ATP-binding protein [Puniceicoccales bacterium]|nr:ATP-binding protein [Puniceicoccales bacterium]
MVIVGGARQKTGKTTLVKAFAASTSGVEYRTLDDAKHLAMAKNDPASFISHEGALMIIDEIQRAPDVILAIKMAVDSNSRQGQFLLTGSADVRTMPTVTESLAGRVRHLRLCSLTQGEILWNPPRFLGDIYTGNFQNIHREIPGQELVKIALRGGFPEPINFSEKERMIWHRDYINSLLDRDLKDFANIRRREAMANLLRTVAGWSSKLINFDAVASGLGITATTVQSYLSMLQMLYVIDRLPPWTATDYQRVNKTDKLFISDTGLMASLLGWGFRDVQLDADRIGKLVETMVFNALSAQIYASENPYCLYHYRDHSGHEIDFILDDHGEHLVGIEVKSGTKVCKDDAKNLYWFSKNITKNRTFIGVVLYSGEHSFSLGENIRAVPLQCLWA